jgi:hypothetical protein
VTEADTRVISLLDGTKVIGERLEKRVVLVVNPRKRLSRCAKRTGALAGRREGGLLVRRHRCGVMNIDHWKLR